MITKNEIVEWLIANETLVCEIVEKTNSRIIMRSIEFHDELKEQEFEEHKRQIVEEASKRLAIHSETFEDNIDNEQLKIYINRLRNK
jgi:hypothetical protein